MQKKYEHSLIRIFICGWPIHIYYVLTWSHIIICSVDACYTEGHHAGSRGFLVYMLCSTTASSIEIFYIAPLKIKKNFLNNLTAQNDATHFCISSKSTLEIRQLAKMLYTNKIKANKTHLTLIFHFSHCSVPCSYTYTLQWLRFTAKSMFTIKWW